MVTRMACAAALALLACVNILFAREPGGASFFADLTARGRSSLYQGNREPLAQSPLIQLPAGCIRPEGWLRTQLELMAGGFTGHLEELSKFCKFQGNAWVDPSGEGSAGWEEVPYWLKGFLDLGYVLNDQRVVAEARRWIEKVLHTQSADGYFGPRGNLTARGPGNSKMIDLWPNMIMMYPLRSYYEATGDRRVIDLMTRYFRWQLTIPQEQVLPASWQKVRGGDNLDSIYWLYNRTGGKWLLDLATRNHERTADWTNTVASWHGVNFAQCFREPAQYFQQARDEKFLRATERNYDTAIQRYGQVPGGMFAADEDARPGYSGPRQAAETCSMVEFMHSDEMLTAISGETVWADRCEDVAFNSLPSSMTSDLEGLHYLTAPNMIQCDRGNKAPMIENEGKMLYYDPWYHRCCQHNVAFGWPFFTENLWMASTDNGLAAVLYAPSRVSATVGDGARARITEKTDYPFGETVELTVSLDRSAKFPLTLRIPAWCDRARVSVNGAVTGVRPHRGSWVVIDRAWKEGDVVRLDLPQEVTVRVWRDNGNTVSVERGPLTYALKIGERWEKSGGTDAWPSYEVFPTTPWNYGLVVDTAHPAASVEVVRGRSAAEGQPFAPGSAPLELRVRARRIPGWRQESNGLIGQIPGSPLREETPVETVTLIPMGCERLRVTVFPRIE